MMPIHSSSRSSARRRVPGTVACIAAFALALSVPLRGQSVTAPLSVTTLAGSAGQRQATEGTGDAARFYAPSGIVVNGSGDLIVADACNNIFRKVTAAGVVTLFSGMPVDPANHPINVGNSDGSASAASFHIGDSASSGGPWGPPSYTIIGSDTLGLDSAGNIYFADTLNDTIRKIAPDGSVTTIAGSPGAGGSSDANGSSARFSSPQGVAADASGNVYVADSANDTIRKVTPQGDVTTFAGTARAYGSADGTGAAARFSNPSGIAIDSGGNLYVTDKGNQTIRKITPAQVVTTLAGGVGLTGTSDGNGTKARFNSPRGIAVDGNGYVYVADTGNDAIRKITPAGTVTTIAGAISVAGSADGTGTAAQFSAPYGVAVGSSGALYVADSSNDTIRVGIPASTSDTLDISEIPPTRIQVTNTTDVTMKVVASGSPSPSFQWSRNGAAISGATSGTLALNSVSAADSGNYSVTVTSGILTYTSALTELDVYAGGTPVPSVRLVSQPADVSVAVGQPATFTVEASSSGSLTYQWSKDGTAIPGATGSSYTVSSAQLADSGTYSVAVSDGTSTTTTSGAKLLVTASSATAPAFTTQPSSQTVAVGGGATFSAAASGSPEPSYQWQKNGVALTDGANVSGSTTATLTLSSVASADAGNYTVVATNAAGSATSNTATLTVNAPTYANGRLINLSLLTTLSANETVRFGFFVGGSGTTGSKPILMRAMGPSLSQYSVPNLLADPYLAFLDGQTVVSQDDDWGGDAAISAAVTRVQAFPFISNTSTDAAIYDPAVTSTGPHTLEITGKGGAGNVIAELYDATAAADFTATTPRLINVSCLKNIGNLTTLGFTIDGSASIKVLIRAVGPGIAAAPFNVPGAMADPKLELHGKVSGADTVLASNDNWGGTADLTAAFNTVQAFQLDPASKDAALLMTLNPGTYTVLVSPASGATGIALVELYEVP